MSGGTLLYKQDFGGNDISDLDISLTPFSPPGYSSLTFSDTALFNQGYYSLTKIARLLYPPEYYTAFDHTHSGDSTRGYLMFAHSGKNQVDRVVYQTDIDNLCNGMTLSFSAWCMDINDHSGDSWTTIASPKIEMQMVNKITGDILATSGTTTVPKGNSWKQYGFDFDLPAGITNIRFRILNKEPSDVGNDLGLDDIEIRFCAPPVTTTLPDSIEECERTPLTLSGAYEDDGTFGDDLSCRWEYSTTGNINMPYDWSPISNDSTTNSGSISLSYTIPSLILSDSGYYRLVVSKPTSIDNWACRASSKVIQLTVKERPQVSIIGSDSICTGTNTKLSPTTGGTWTSTDSAVATVTNDGIVTGVTAGSAKFIFTSSETGCFDTTDFVYVDTFPIVGNITAENTVCINAEISLSCTPSDGIWSISNNNAQIIGDKTDNPIKIRGVTEGRVYVTYTLGLGVCQSKSTFLLKIVPASKPTIKIGF